MSQVSVSVLNKIDRVNFAFTFGGSDHLVVRAPLALFGKGPEASGLRRDLLGLMRRLVNNFCPGGILLISLTGPLSGQELPIIDTTALTTYFWFSCISWKKSVLFPPKSGQYAWWSPQDKLKIGPREGVGHVDRLAYVTGYNCSTRSGFASSLSQYA
ncbi:hypothetical protein FA15DRAFT_661388 [Coprinopsis marcescibilis]|uniref:Uncharacterized protein n=1 Tax=Coprinopsis marcescibilis TaxID=230819 RepID=A0A5C3KBS2_COPMA|nr:hypothetical protein FA15DRAFT_661388 [Coprinopsis marcescibilis]